MHVYARRDLCAKGEATGTLGLDLTDSRAKVARAREHAQALEREVDLVLEEKKLYTVRIDEVDPQSGWCSIYCTVSDLHEPRLGVIFGDVVDNLRSALDCVVVALAGASGVTPANKHKFPIFDDATAYDCAVGQAGAPRKGGPLGGLRHGTELIEALQPYNTHEDPFASPLWDIREFSNANKHREVSVVVSLIGEGDIQIAHGGRIVGRWRTLGLRPGEQEQEILRVQFAAPYPEASELRVDGQSPFAITFTTPAFMSRQYGAGLDVRALLPYSDSIAEVLDGFAAL